jgi:hypothetical protein
MIQRPRDASEDVENFKIVTSMAATGPRFPIVETRGGG